MLSYIKSNIGNVIEFGDRNYLIYRVNEPFNEVYLSLTNGGYTIFSVDAII